MSGILTTFPSLSCTDHLLTLGLWKGVWLLLKEESFETWCSVLSYLYWPLNATILNKWQLRLGKRAISYGELLYANSNKAVSLGEYPLCVYTETFS